VGNGRNGRAVRRLLLQNWVKEQGDLDMGIRRERLDLGYVRRWIPQDLLADNTLTPLGKDSKASSV
jgi:hypothetical protein